jgi:hypothetical protein
MHKTRNYVRRYICFFGFVNMTLDAPRPSLHSDHHKSPLSDISDCDPMTWTTERQTLKRKRTALNTKRLKARPKRGCMAAAFSYSLFFKPLSHPSCNNYVLVKMIIKLCFLLYQIMCDMNGRARRPTIRARCIQSGLIRSDRLCSKCRMLIRFTQKM